MAVPRNGQVWLCYFCTEFGEITYFLFMVCCRQLHSLIYRISSLSGKAFLGPQGHIFLLFRNLPTDQFPPEVLEFVKTH